MKGFYPTHMRDGLEKLRFYARRFPCVEVDTFTYAIPQPANVQKWAECTPPGFLFHPKLFGAFCGQDVEVGQLPCSVRALPSMGGWRERLKERVSLARLPEDALEALWGCYHEALAPLQAAGRLGVVMMQVAYPHSDPHFDPHQALNQTLSQTLTQTLTRCRPSSRRARRAAPPLSAHVRGSARKWISPSSCVTAAGRRRSGSRTRPRGCVVSAWAW